MKVLLISCYRHEYIRFSVLKSALELLPDVELSVIRNKKNGVRRYLEVIKAIIATRHNRPDIYLLTFRGYEILWPLLLCAGNTPIIYDEFINPLVVTREHRMQKTGIVRQLMKLWDLFGRLYYKLARSTNLILLDTYQHATYSAHDGKIPLSQYAAIPVGADEGLFKPGLKNVSNKLQVMFYGHMTPLHGLPQILEAASLLAGEPIEFTIVGGHEKAATAVQAATKRGATIKHYNQKPITELATMIAEADLFLGGPFGGTLQSGLVVTGKTYQSLACQTAVIVGSSDATNQFFKDRQNAIIVPQADSMTLASAILWASKHPEELQEIAKAGRQTFEHSFSTKAIAALLEPSLLKLTDPEPEATTTQ